MESSRGGPFLARGFTLVELLVVLVIMGLTVGLVWPRLDRVLEQTRYRRGLEDVALRLDGLGRYARQRAATIRIGPEGVELEPEPLGEPGRRSFHADTPEAPPDPLVALLGLPEGWRVTSLDGVVYFPSGACSGGELTLIDPLDRRRALTLRAPHCRLSG